MRGNKGKREKNKGGGKGKRVGNKGKREQSSSGVEWWCQKLIHSSEKLSKTVSSRKVSARSFKRTRWPVLHTDTDMIPNPSWVRHFCMNPYLAFCQQLWICANPKSGTLSTFWTLQIRNPGFDFWVLWLTVSTYNLCKLWTFPAHPLETFEKNLESFSFFSQNFETCKSGIWYFFHNLKLENPKFRIIQLFETCQSDVWD